MIRHVLVWMTTISLAGALAQGAGAQEAPAAGVRRALVICGLAGDADHRTLYAGTLERIYAGLTQHHGFAAEHVAVLWGDEQQDTDGPAVKASRGVSTREAIVQTVEQLAASVGEGDALWVFVLGHGHYDGRYSWLNVAGDDLHQLDFAKLFAGIRCREQVFFLTQSASGFYLKALAQPGRVVVAATEPDLEVNETIFAHKLAQGLAEPPVYRELDIDGDGSLSLLDLYLWSARETAQEYVTGDLLTTEHAQLDDSGDGRGTEIQADYLSEELGGRRRATDELPAVRTGDGGLARRIFLRYPPSPPAPDAQ
jgi:hypothetical protein